MPPDSQGRFSDGLRQGLHILVISSFAVAQPLFDILGRNATFFVAQRAGAADIVGLAAILLLLPPLLVMLVSGLISIVWPRGARLVREIAVGGLFALAVAAPVARNVGALVAVPLMLALTLGGTLAYRRIAQARQVLTWLAPAPLAFGALFLFGSPVRDLVLPATPVARVSSAGSGAPVVVVTFDEFSLISLMKPDGTLDRKNFPNFARLANHATWYPGATTVHTGTHIAVPASLSGMMPTGEKVLPIAANHPDNLFSLLGGRYEMRTFESVTRLCPRGLCEDFGARPANRSLMAKDIAIVYLHLMLPKDVADRKLPPLGDRWAGFGGGGDGDFDSADLDASSLRPTFKELHRGPGSENRIAYFQRFLDSIERPTKPTLWYLHMLLPHKPWRYLPSGQVYEGPAYTHLGWTASLWSSNRYLTRQAQQRYVLQVKYVDGLLGRVLDRLEQAGIFDDTLFVTYADHGIAFRPNAPPRNIVPSNVAEILPVPLFVKLPHQQRGVVDRRNAQIIDVLPTIADGLQIPLPWEADGFSLIAPDPKLQQKFSFSGRVGRQYPAVIGGLREASAELRSLFGGSLDNVFSFGPNAELVGRAVKELTVDDEGGGVELDLARQEAYADVDPAGAFLPARLTGVAQGSGAREGRPIAVAVGGVIAGVGEMFTLDGRVEVSVMLDPTRFKKGRNVIRVFVVRSNGHLVPMRILDSIA